MNSNELLTLVGLAWSRLIIYPGGLAVFALLWFVARSQEPGARSQESVWVPARSSENRSWEMKKGSCFSVLSSVVLPWLGLALLPLPAAAPMSRKTDVIMLLALLEWPRLIAIARELHATSRACQRAGTRRLAAALNSYPTLMLATLALAQPSGSLDIAALALPPADTAPSGIQASHWLGAIAWTFALAPLLGLGPFRADAPAHHRWRAPINGWGLGMFIRGCGLAAIAALPWLAPFGALAEQGSYTTATLVAIVLAPLALGGLVWCYDRFTARQSARRWAKAYLALDSVLIVALLWAAYVKLPAS